MDKVDRSRDEWIIKSYLDGLKVNSIAKGLGITRTRLYQIITRLRTEGRLLEYRKPGIHKQKKTKRVRRTPDAGGK